MARRTNNKSEEKVEVRGLIYVNLQKKARAEEIVAFVTGAKATKSEDEAERKSKFAALLENEGKIDAKDDGDAAVQFVYEKLGGLLRTQEEQDESSHKGNAVNVEEDGVVDEDAGEKSEDDGE